MWISRVCNSRNLKVWHTNLNYSCSSVRWNKIPSREAMRDFDLLIDEDLIHLQEEMEAGDKYAIKQTMYRWK